MHTSKIKTTEQDVTLVEHDGVVDTLDTNQVLILSPDQLDMLSSDNIPVEITAGMETLTVEGLLTSAATLAANTNTTMNTNNTAPAATNVAATITALVAMGQEQTSIPEGLIRVINPRDKDAVTALFLSDGVSRTGVDEFFRAAPEVGFLGLVEVIDLTPMIEYMNYIEKFHGSVGLVGNGGTLTRGFTFRTDVKQKVYLLRGAIHSNLEAGLSKYRTSVGSVVSTFLFLPEIKGGVASKAGSGQPPLPASHGILRILINEISDEDGLIKPYFQNTWRGAAQFNDHAPNAVYEAARELGVDNNWLRVRETTRAEINHRKLQRQASGRGAYVPTGANAGNLSVHSGRNNSNNALAILSALTANAGR